MTLLSGVRVAWPLCSRTGRLGAGDHAKLIVSKRNVYEWERLDPAIPQPDFPKCISFVAGSKSFFYVPLSAVLVIDLKVLFTGYKPAVSKPLKP